MGATGTIRLHVKRGRVWRPVHFLGGSGLESFGRFELVTSIGTTLRRGEKLRAQLVHCYWCSDTSTKTIVTK